MRFNAATILLAAFCAWILALPACSLRPGGSKPRTVAATPKPIPPQAPPAEPAPELPISVPQTQVTLPSPQPIQAEALATARPATPPAPEPASPAVRQQRNQAVSRPESRQPAANPAPPAGPPTAQANPPGRVRIRPVESDAERRRLMSTITARQKQVQGVLAKAKNRHLTETEKSAVERIEAFLDQTRAALKDQDLQQAEALSNRALLLSQVLN